jgi:hypothetical protein
VFWKSRDKEHHRGLGAVELNGQQLLSLDNHAKPLQSEQSDLAAQVHNFIVEEASVLERSQLTKQLLEKRLKTPCFP